MQGDGGSSENDFDHAEVLSEEINQMTSKVIHSSSEFESELESQDKTEHPLMSFTNSEKEMEEEKNEFSFRFKFPTFEEFSRSQKANDDLFHSELVSSTSISGYESFSRKSHSGFVDEPEVPHFDDKQISIDSSCHNSIQEENLGNDQICSDSVRIVELCPALPSESLNAENSGINEEKGEEATVPIQEIAEPVVEAKDKCLPKQEVTEEVHFHPQKEDVASCSNSVSSPSMGSYTDGFLSDADFEDEFEFDALMMDFNGEKAEYFWKEVAQLEKNRESEDFDEEDSDILEELWKLEEEQVNHTDVSKSQYLSEQDINEDLDKINNDPVKGKDHETVPGSRDCDYERAAYKDSSESGDPNELETLWEHQELIEQLKMELKKVRATGLPTILEESESPKITEDLKPWKIEEKFHHEECMDELHKFYKSYRERMRKFDIFNYQKMYAMGFLQLKDPLQSISSRKSSGPALKTLLSQNFWHLKHRISDSDPMVKFMKELQGDLEVVYVGQMCLSWEILHWEYEKALDLWDSDPHLIHQYNEVAGEFQQFQVLMQRFIEDEPFQGPRVQYYTKSRCVNRYLLQVPVIRVDKKDRRRARKGNRPEDAITSDMLVEMMEESIRILWRFIRADKDSCSAMVKSHKAKPTQLQNPDDLDLLIEVRKVFQKKERKLKEVLRSGNCILKRFRKYRVDDLDQVLYFFSQVDMKLVCRVLNMSKITRDQLIWCHSKLNNISFEQRKIQLEPSFLLFPC